jgi:hypothetical protein
MLIKRNSPPAGRYLEDLIERVDALVAHATVKVGTLKPDAARHGVDGTRYRRSRRQHALAGLTDDLLAGVLETVCMLDDGLAQRASEVLA